MQIANHEMSKVLSRANECMRRLIEAGISYEDLQAPIDDPNMRKRLVVYWKNPVTALRENTLIIEYKPFTLKGWEGDTEIKIRTQDTNSKALREVDLNAVMLETGLPSDKKHTSNADRIQNLKETGRILLDAHAFQVIWENLDSIPEWWKETVNGRPKSILFAGTTFGEPYENYFTLLRLSFYKNEWHKWHNSSVDYSADENVVFATIADFSN